TGFARPVGPGTAKIVATAGPSRVESSIVVAAKPRAWDFDEDIEPILTKVGCNAGNCHGRAAGQNGFHLSLFGYDPEADHRSLTRDAGGRRLSPMDPEDSLLLRKASGRAPHGGGLRLPAGSDDYRALVAWIRAG